jgi:putative heme utilization carrier protein HutX
MSAVQAAATPMDELVRLMAAEPGGVIEDVAKRHDVTCRQVVEALPAEMRRFAPGTAFADAMMDISRWGDVTLIVNTDDGIMEFSGPIAEGKVGGSYYNIGGRTGFHGHLRHERCTSVGFVERPFMGRSSAFVAFFNGEGGIMFKVFVGRDDKRDLKTDQVVAFNALAARLGATA